MEWIEKRLWTLADSKYKAFNEKLIPTGYEIMGVRMPELKKLAKEIAAHPEVEAYLQSTEYRVYEHVLLYGLVVGYLKNLPLEDVFRYLDPLILSFDNWAHVDTIISVPKIFRKYPEEVLSHFLPLKFHEGEFTKRTFVLVLMDYYMNETYIEDSLIHLTEVPQGQYYVDMAIAWALSMGLIKYYEQTFPFIEKRAFSKFVHNKAIQKARESYRIDPQVKELLNTLKIK